MPNTEGRDGEGNSIRCGNHRGVLGADCSGVDMKKILAIVFLILFTFSIVSSSYSAGIDLAMGFRTLAVSTVAALGAIPSMSAGAIVSVALASGAVGYCLYTGVSLTSIYNWAVGILGGAVEYLSGVGSRTYTDAAGRSITVGISEGPGNYVTVSKSISGTMTPILSFPYDPNNDPGSPTHAQATASAVQYAQGVVNGAVDVATAKSADATVPISLAGLTPGQIATAPAVNGYASPGLAAAIAGGAGYTLGTPNVVANADVPVMAGTVGAVANDGAVGDTLNVNANLDKSGLATDALQQQQTVSLDNIAVGVQSLPDRLADSLRPSSGSQTIAERWGEIATVAGGRFPFSMITMISTTRDQWGSGFEDQGRIELGGFNLINGNDATRVNIDWNQNVMSTASEWFRRLMSWFFYPLTLLYIYRRVNTL